MNTQKQAFLKKAENELFEQVMTLRNRSNESLESGAQYCFVLCNAKINFINSLINDVRFAMSGHAPDVFVDSVIEAVKHVEENFKPFLGTPCGTSVCSTEKTQFQKEMAFLEDKPRLGDTIDIQLLLDLSHDLEMNGRQFISREQKIREMKSTETYSCPHGQDLIYYHIKSSMIKSLIRKVYEILTESDERVKSIYKEHFEYEYNNYKQYYTHSEFLDAMDEKYKNC